MQIIRYVLAVSLIFIMGCWHMMEREPHLFSSEYIKKENEEILKSRKRRQEYLKSHKYLSKRQKDLIEAGILGVGLIKEQVKLIKNVDPDEIRLTDKYDATEAWIYKFKSAAQILYFKDMILIEIE